MPQHRNIHSEPEGGVHHFFSFFEKASNDFWEDLASALDSEKQKIGREMQKRRDDQQAPPNTPPPVENSINHRETSNVTSESALVRPVDNYLKR
jgi:hypothetical protein